MFRFFKDFFIYGIASVLSKIIAVFLMPVYTSVLTREEYGAMALIVSCKGIIDLVSNLNIHSGIARDYYEKDVNRSKLVSTGFYSILTLSISILCILIITRNFWTESVLGLPQKYDSAFLFMLLSIPAGSILSYFSILTRFKKKPILYTIGSLIQISIQISISVIGVVVLRYGVISVFVAVLIAELFGIFYFAFINREYIEFSFEWKYLKKALLYAIPTLPAILAGWIDTSVGQILISKYVSMEDLGVYSVALQFASIFTLISVGLNNTWGPFLYENYTKESFKKQVNNLFTIIVLVLTLVSVTISLLSKELVLLLSNPSYINAAQYIALLCIPMTIYLLFPIVSSGISISRDTKYIGIAYIVGSLINILFLLLLMPTMGIIIVPISLALSRIVSYVIQYVVTKRKGILTLPSKCVLFLIVMCIAMYFVVSFDVSLIHRIILLIIIDGFIIWHIAKKYDIKEFIHKYKYIKKQS